MTKRVFATLLIVGFPWIAVNVLWGQSSPNSLEKLKRYSFAEPHMGTLFRIVFYAENEPSAQAAAKAAFARIEELNRILSDYQPESELMRLCKKAGGEPVEVSRDLFTVVKKAVEFAESTEGALDITLGPVVRLWRRARKLRKLPNPDEIRQALDKVDYKKIRLCEKGRTVQLLLMDMMLDLGSIGKGYAADAALEVLRKLGFPRALVVAGGDIATGEAPPDAKAWKIGIAPLKNPEAAPTHFLALTNAGVSTSGDSEQFLEIDGKRYSHVVDPKTGIGLIGRRSVTVIAPNAMTSDGLDTPCCVMGLERSLRFLEGQPELAGLLMFELDDGIKTVATKRFERFLWKD